LYVLGKFWGSFLQFVNEDRGRSRGTYMIWCVLYRVSMLAEARVQ
jgi:hypothetical protein